MEEKKNLNRLDKTARVTLTNQAIGTISALMQGTYHIALSTWSERPITCDYGKQEVDCLNCQLHYFISNDRKMCGTVLSDREVIRRHLEELKKEQAAGRLPTSDPLDCSDLILHILNFIESVSMLNYDLKRECY